MDKSYVSRVNQLDSDLLDKEITKIIQEQLGNVYKELPLGLLSKFQPEIDCVLKSIIWVCSIHRNSSTFGQQILAITYHKDQLTRHKLILHYLLTICAPYAKDFSHLRLTSHLMIQKTIAWMECFTKILTVLNFFRFLKVGVHPSLVDYALSWSHASNSGTKMRNIGYDYMNRELIWTGFLELLNVTVPLINLHSMKRRITSALKPSIDHQLLERHQPVLDANTKCAICLQRPSLPHHIHCRHVFCYYCLQANVLADSKFQCPICDYPGSGDIFPIVINFN